MVTTNTNIRRARGIATAAGLLTIGGIAIAAPAMAVSEVDAVTIDCVGDTVRGHVEIADPGDGTVKIELWGRSGNASQPFSPISSIDVVSQDDEFEVPYSFQLPKHRTAYKAVATIGGSSRTSYTIMDKTCQPPAEIPEAGVAAAVPAALAAAGGAVWLTRRRRAAATR